MGSHICTARTPSNSTTMSFSEGRRWIHKKHFEGMPTMDDFELISEPLPELKENEILVKPEFWSVDPYARIYAIAFGYKLPMTMLGSQVAKVLESKNPKFPVGSHVIAYAGGRLLWLTLMQSMILMARGPQLFLKWLQHSHCLKDSQDPCCLDPLGCPATRHTLDFQRFATLKQEKQS